MTENNIKVIVAAWAMFYVCIATEIASISVSVAVISTSGLRYSFYFRFVPDAVLRSRMMSVPVELDRVCLKTVS